ncbi:class I SAM-dependent methyltransferase [Actinomadura sp. CNU-125]|uniref:class I SAM-dependent methyltransferase n=1 Tax=Actinomadura sp. CNU-125 TaxID=1904961 RepID=UPI00096AAD12|nr:class I SAM-dependent methyltransferase [Actinomadura sp. CNU-125]
MAVDADYDADPERFRLAARVTRRYLIGARSLHDHVAAKLRAAAPSRVLDVGCGEGALNGALPGSPPFRLVGLDASAELLRAHPGPAVRGDAARLPFGDGTFDAVTAVNMLYHLDDPVPALREARRVLAPGGLLLRPRSAAPTARAGARLVPAAHPVRRRGRARARVRGVRGGRGRTLGRAADHAAAPRRRPRLPDRAAGRAPGRGGGRGAGADAAAGHQARRADRRAGVERPARASGRQSQPRSRAARTAACRLSAPSLVTAADR